ncbi:SdpI family protein [Paenibacillus whitsoniae]|uniref:DUF1648 domain-containing protein n=1 Tax=Paenibacillus whitsoniae TaxID=2496558 RepID=A0A3S0AJX4_9BACL|nr:SdpI family protein [Paenibacillus whitsoniae]RTE02001.1 DUF1648 domain-containing protein [Paenibacillus whitsoniae]
MKKIKEILLLIISFSPAIWALIVYNQLPDTVASHFGANNEPNGWMSKNGMIIVLVLLGFMPLFLKAVRAIDPKRGNFSKFPVAFEVTRIGVSILLAAAGWGMLLYNLGYHVQMSKIVLVAIGVLFAVMGNFMTQVKPNYTFGIRTPWTLANDEIWRKTHRMGGPLMMLGGVFAFIAAFVTNGTAVIVLIAAMIAMFLVPVLYSYVLYARMPK